MYRLGQTGIASNINCSGCLYHFNSSSHSSSYYRSQCACTVTAVTSQTNDIVHNNLFGETITFTSSSLASLPQLHFASFAYVSSQAGAGQLPVQRSQSQRSSSNPTEEW